MSSLLDNTQVILDKFSVNEVHKREVNFTHNNIKCVATTKIIEVIQNDKWSDFKIIVGESEFPVYKIALIAESRFFADYFQQAENLEKKSFKIEDYDPEVIKHALKFIYIHHQNFEQYCEKLYLFSQEYQVDELSKAVQQKMSTQLALDTVCLTYNFAVTQKAELLAQSCLQYIKEHPRELGSGNFFKDLESERCREILNEICKTYPGKEKKSEVNLTRNSISRPTTSVTVNNPANPISLFQFSSSANTSNSNYSLLAKESAAKLSSTSCDKKI
ncbi:hypothetical protein FO519_004159 [Halicephalobus sp. NKZ332]|nr:hypothetical protein FO519_004159 [Halicephalobus sp. NKZ332]